MVCVCFLDIDIYSIEHNGEKGEEEDYEWLGELFLWKMPDGSFGMLALCHIRALFPDKP